MSNHRDWKKEKILYLDQSQFWMGRASVYIYFEKVTGVNNYFIMTFLYMIPSGIWAIVHLVEQGILTLSTSFIYFIDERYSDYNVLQN